ncbi:beta-ketoacyl synthase N-terminal-like domain-containing protein [Streptomyces sp. NPDC056708]|uniref:thiolase C-terminal domain-containing protein n=1 Tax=unclassified Streptomyces TaxID=2593676 RepID=UPI00369D69E8
MTGEVAVLGAGMHPWGKWGRSFVEYGTVAARTALGDAGIGWQDVQSVVGADTVRGGYPGYVAGATFAQALGWQGARVASVYAACASGAQAINTARAQILAGLAEVVLVVGADAAPKGFFVPAGGDRPDDPDWLRFRVLGATNPAYFALYARRRMAVIPANPSGGLASFGEAVPAQAIAQVCELTWQLRGTADRRQVPGARVGITANQGLFGHGSAVVAVR